MIDAVSFENAHQFGDVLPALHKLRNRVFVERQRWDLDVHKDMEFDAFDTPATVHLVWRDEAGDPRAVTRLVPTVRPYMIRELWPDLVQDVDLPVDENVWEASRFGVDRGFGAQSRREIIGELVCGCLEYGLENAIREYICVMPIQIINRVLIGSGCDVEVLGETSRLGGYRVAAGRVNITEISLARARRHYGIKGSVLATPPPESRRAA